ncbi:MAG: hypothetical protein JWL85_263 [Candidatus Saccharibacteria bacterium]|nr:hypothetical protein [Candidatus Saccharibacteria bacterium]
MAKAAKGGWLQGPEWDIPVVILSVLAVAFLALAYRGWFDYLMILAWVFIGVTRFRQMRSRPKTIRSKTTEGEEK